MTHSKASEPRLSTPGKVALAALVVVTFTAGWAAWHLHRRPGVTLSGEELNRTAWEACFRERDLPVPPSGPRDGYWGARMPEWTKDPDLGWHETEAHLPGLVEEDASGVQEVTTPGARRHLLIVGGSVAWGAYASSIETTYFSRLARQLSRQGLPLSVSVLAAGAWVSEIEVKAFRSRGVALDPDLVLFLDGLNDLTQARDAPEEDRVETYLSNMRAARDVAAANAVPVVFALQPFLLQKKTRSDLETRILELSLDKTLPEALLRRSYPKLRSGLRVLANGKDSYFLDCSGAFDDERPTTFTDLWHFPDPGHRILAEHLAEGLRPILLAHPAPVANPD